MKIPLANLLKPATTMLKNVGQQFSIGLDLGLDRLNLVQMENHDGKPRIRAIASLPLGCTRDEIYDHPSRLKDLLVHAYAQQPFKGKRVVSCLPTDLVKIITVPYRHTEKQSDAEAVVSELQDRMRSELNEMVVDFKTLRHEEDESGKREALVALAPRNRVEAYLDLLGAAGLSVDALDIGPAALVRLVSHAGAILSSDFPLTPNVLLVNFGAESSFVTVISGRRLMLDRAVEFSENGVLARLKQSLDMSHEVASNLLYHHADADGSKDREADQMIMEVLRPQINQLVQEINKTMIYMASKTRGKSVDMVYLAGGIAHYGRMLNSLQAQLQVPVCLLDPLEVFESNQLSTHIREGLGTMVGLAMTTGLALRGVPEHG